MKARCDEGKGMPVNSFENYPMSWKPKLEKDKGFPALDGRGYHCKDYPKYLSLGKRIY